MNYIKFQCVSWLSEDTTEYSDDGENKYYISIFGRTNEGQSISIRTHYQPFFFIEVPRQWEKYQISSIESELREELDRWGRSGDDLLSVSILKRKKFYGFTNNELFRFVRFRFQTKETMSKAVKIFQGTQRKQPLKVFGKTFELYEANVDPMLRFFHLQNITPAGWCECHSAEVSVDKITNCDLEYEIPDWKSLKGTPDEHIAPVVQASFDIETYSHDGGFPDPNQNCEVIQIATTLQRFGESEPYKRHIVTLKQCNPIEGVDVESYNTESEVLMSWQRLLQKEQVDILIGYNIWGFDLWYMYTRAKNLGCWEFMLLGKLVDVASEMKKASFSSGAYGDSDYFMVNTPGIMQIDLLVIMKREHKLQSYSLNNVAAHFLKDNKVDMPYKLMFKKYASGTPSEITEIAEYCVKDTDLPLRLVNKLAIVPNMFEMAKATWVPLSFLIERGQGIKVFSQILYTTLQENMLVYTSKRSSDAEQEAYEGATVLKAKKGAYMENPITGLDFASLYPTIMRAHNLCHSTIVMDDEKYGNIDGLSYDIIDGYKFAQSPEGILPKMLRVLAQNRKAAKKAMAKAADDGDSFMKAVYNGKQLAFKVSMNSIYGFCGATVGFLPCKPVAQCTTSKGRDMIEHTKNLVEKWYPGSEVVYGDTDSVMVKFKTEKTGKDAIDESFKLGEEAADRISETFRNPIELEMEKVYYPYLLFSKKRYAGLMYTNPKEPDYIDAKGIQLVRRDNCPYVKRISKSVLDTIMYEQDIDKAISMCQESAAHLLSGEINVDDLVVSKSMKRISYSTDIPRDCKYLTGTTHYLIHDYANANQPHLIVALKREEREPGTGPKSGDRVPYVFVETRNPKDLQYQKAEDPDYVKQHNLKIDRQYYLEHGMESPLCSLFELFIDNPAKVLFGKQMESYINARNEQIDIYELLGVK